MTADTIRCGWFALCDHPAAGVVRHPILGDVPTCQRCTDRLGLALVPFVTESLLCDWCDSTHDVQPRNGENLCMVCRTTIDYHTILSTTKEGQP